MSEVERLRAQLHDAIPGITVEMMGRRDLGIPPHTYRPGDSFLPLIDALTAAVRAERDRGWLACWPSDQNGPILSPRMSTKLPAAMGYEPDSAGGWRKKKRDE